MVVSLVDALVVPDLAQLGMVVATTVACPCTRRYASPSTKRMTNDFAIPLSPFLCPKKHAQKRFEIKNLEGEGPPEPMRLRTTEVVARRGFCGQGNGDRGMVVSLMDALVVPSLAQLGMVVARTVACPCTRRFASPSTKRMTNDIAIPLFPFLCPQTNMRKEVRNQKSGERGASRAGAIEDDRDGSAAGLLRTREWGQGNGRVVGGRVGCS